MNEKSIDSKETKNTNFILVKYGKHTLNELLKDIKTGDEFVELLDSIYKKQWPPVWRDINKCSESEITTFKKLVTFLRAMNSQSDTDIRSF